MPKNIQSQDSKTTFKQNLTCIFLSARVNSKGTLQYETPCMYYSKTSMYYIASHFQLPSGKIGKNSSYFLQNLRTKRIDKIETLLDREKEGRKGF